MNTSKKLLALKERADDALDEMHRLEGAQRQEMASLKKKYGCKSLAQAAVALGKARDSLSRSKKQLDRNVRKIARLMRKST